MVGTQGISDKWAEEELAVERYVKTACLDERLEVELCYRFRPNIVFKGADAPFLEDVVTELRISSDQGADDGTTGIIYLVSKCARCLVRIIISEID